MQLVLLNCRFQLLYHLDNKNTKTTSLYFNKSVEGRNSLSKGKEKTRRERLIEANDLHSFPAVLLVDVSFLAVWLVSGLFPAI